jgi:hypothetical protein
MALPLCWRSTIGALAAHDVGGHRYSSACTTDVVMTYNHASHVR